MNNIKKRRTARKLLALLPAICILLSCFTNMPVAKAAGDLELPVTVTFHQTEARTELYMVNEFRTGDNAWYWNEDNSERVVKTDLNALQYDYTLEEIAMQRAVDLAVSYSHTRPDGESCFTTYDDYGFKGYSMGENIAWGYSTAASVFVAWREDNDPYSGQGHRRNMLNEDFNVCAFACVETENGRFWVQEFAKTYSPNLTATAANDSKVTRNVKLSSNKIVSVSLQNSPVLKCGGSVDLSENPVVMKYTTEKGQIEIKPEVSPVWSVADETIAGVSGNTLTGLKKGETTLNGSFNLNGKTLTASSKVTVQESKLTLSETSVVLKSGETVSITAEIAPEETLYWSTSDAGVCDFRYANLTSHEGTTQVFWGIRSGNAVITVSNADGSVKGTIPVTVYLPVDSVYFVNAPKTLEVGESAKLKAAFIPSGASDPSLSWKSSNESVLTVNSEGVITGMSEGEATVTATTIGKYNNTADTVQTKSITITVTAKEEESTETGGTAGEEESTETGDTAGEEESTETGDTTGEEESSGSEETPAEESTDDVLPTPEPQIEPITEYADMYRLYNPNSGEHFYTNNALEREALVKAGWKYENIAWKAPKHSNTPVYRLYNPNSGDHHYTTQVDEKNNLVNIGWKSEGIGWYSDDHKGSTLYRLYNPNCTGAGSHHYTTNAEEVTNLLSLGWKAEGIAWYGMDDSV